MDNKLLNLPHILWINLNKNVERKEYMENLLNNYNLANTRIEAFDGNDYDTFSNIKNLNTKEEKGTLGCFCSHIKALEFFVKTDSLGDYCLIAEDDLSFEYISYWKKTFWEYIKEAPPNFNIIQLTLTYAYAFMMTHKDKFPTTHIMTRRLPYMYGAGMYLITRKAAKMLLSFILKTNDNIYDLKLIKNTISDCFIYETINNVYSLPLFTFSTNLGSDIHEEHIDRIHIPCKNIITSIWKNNTT